MAEPPSNEPKPQGILSRLAPDPGAWQPFTGGGVARFAQAGIWRTWIALGTASLAVGTAFGWMLLSTWWPVVQQAASRFPETPVLLRSGRLDWKEPTARLLAEGPQLGIAHRPAGSEPVGLTADLQAELTPTHLRIVGIAGFVDLPWHRDLELELDRRDALAGWGAWRLPVLAVATVGMAALVFLVGVSLATVLCLPVWLVLLPFRRGPGPGGAWKLVAAADAPAALLLAAAFAAYSFRWISWPGLLLAVAGHPLVTLGLLTWSLFHVEPAARSTEPEPFGGASQAPNKPKGTNAKTRPPKGNPFQPADAADSKNAGGGKGTGRKKNPFRGGPKD